MIRSYQATHCPPRLDELNGTMGQPAAIAYAPAQTTRKPSAADERWTADYPRLRIGWQLRAPIPAVCGAAIERQGPTDIVKKVKQRRIGERLIQIAV